nr:pirin family protein [uncultured Desulfobacter sp.]
MSENTGLNIVSNIAPLGFNWPTVNPFLFCVHHKDDYPAGNEQLGPNASLAGRNIGQDFTIKDGWRMYHGQRIPGFPVHPHRGFETVTIVLNGFVDHSDSLGAAGRYGNGDVQWMTAGAGIQHAEMFPLLRQDKPNPLELFQIWLNLPRKKKFVTPYYAMLWAEQIPTRREKDAQGSLIDIRVIAGAIQDTVPPGPTPDSWANDPANEVAIWLIKMGANARWTLPAASAGINRALYFYKGDTIQAAGTMINNYHSADLASGHPVPLKNGSHEASLLLLQGKPINEPVAQHGPFVMNTQGEISQAYNDYQTTQFGGWPWSQPDPTHGSEQGRFSQYTDGKRENR